MEASVSTNWEGEVSRNLGSFLSSVTLRLAGSGVGSRGGRGEKMMRRVLVFSVLGLVLSAAPCFAQGACPLGLPVVGINCYFVAANGADTNNGTSESTPWLHAPGMPKCANACLTKANNGMNPGEGVVFRGGDTWHFGNSGATPFTGGTWDLTGGPAGWHGDPSTCIYEGTQTGCIYWGVDLTTSGTGWFNAAVCGASWCRPRLNGDNPLSTTTVASCAFQIPNNTNVMIIQGVGSGFYNILDNFELLGLCTQRLIGGDGTQDVYIYDGGSGVSGQGMLFQENLYFHGWTATTTAGTGNNAIACNTIGGGDSSLHSIVAVVVDGSDSDPRVCAWGIFPSFYHFKDSMIRYTTQGVGGYCHDIHDNIFEHFYNPNVPTHGNIFECNDDADGKAPGQPQNTPNVVYNNIFRHDDPSFGAGGQVHLWLCPEVTPEYYFNNLFYDIADENYIDIAGPPTYTCPNSGGQFMFNNTLVDGTQPCYLGPNNTGGKYLTISNEHLINSGLDGSGAGGCTGKASATNISMTVATAISQGYLQSSGGTTNADTCANEATRPCSPTSATNGTVGAGANQQAYCTKLASYSSEFAIGTEAANACKFGTTDGCTYNISTHAMVCPAQTAAARPASTAWDSGAYQFTAAMPPNAASMLVATPH
jgi:hypothetical protein